MNLLTQEIKREITIQLHLLQKEADLSVLKKRQSTSMLFRVATRPLPGKYSKLSTDTEGRSLPIL